MNVAQAGRGRARLTLQQIDPLDTEGLDSRAGDRVEVDDREIRARRANRLASTRADSRRPNVRGGSRLQRINGTARHAG